MQEKQGNNATVYYTDANGQYYGFKNYTVGSYSNPALASTYHYVYNGQGDVIKILQGSAVVAEYEYDAWGRITKIMGRQSPAGTLIDITDGSNPTWVAHTNPIRYRGYYYDVETGLYYCQSRYYDPVVGRFVNADGLVSTGQGVLGNNMFAYCGNNPTNNYDPGGTCWHRLWIFGDCDECEKPKKRTKQIKGSWSGITIINGSIVIDLGKGWSARIDPANPDIKLKRHVHVYKDGEEYSQNDDGSPHDNSTGSPPKKVKETLKDKVEWDWDTKANDYEFNKYFFSGPIQEFTLFPAPFHGPFHVPSFNFGWSPQLPSIPVFP